jgi:hypothetical protein
MGNLSKMALAHLGSPDNRKIRVDIIYNSVTKVPQYGSQISRDDLNPQKCAYAIDVANSM